MFYLPTSDPTSELRTVINIICSRNNPSGINDEEIQASIIRQESISFKSKISYDIKVLMFKTCFRSVISPAVPKLYNYAKVIINKNAYHRRKHGSRRHKPELNRI